MSAASCTAASTPIFSSPYRSFLVKSSTNVGYIVLKGKELILHPKNDEASVETYRLFLCQEWLKKFNYCFTGGKTLQVTFPSQNNFLHRPSNKTKTKNLIFQYKIFFFAGTPSLVGASLNLSFSEALKAQLRQGLLQAWLHTPEEDLCSSNVSRLWSGGWWERL